MVLTIMSSKVTNISMFVSLFSCKLLIAMQGRDNTSRKSQNRQEREDQLKMADNRPTAESDQRSLVWQRWYHRVTKYKLESITSTYFALLDTDVHSMIELLANPRISIFLELCSCQQNWFSTNRKWLAPWTTIWSRWKVQNICSTELLFWELPSLHT